MYSKLMTVFACIDVSYNDPFMYCPTQVVCDFDIARLGGRSVGGSWDGGERA